MLGLLQGVTELFPISSLGHSVILPQLLGWDIHQNDDYFITFLVATHLATAIVLFLFFWRDWVRILEGIGRSLRDRGIAPDDADAKLGWLLVVGTIPAGVLGLLLEHALRNVFASATVGVVLPDAQRPPALRRRGAAPARPADGRRRRHAHRARRSASRRRSASVPRRRSRSSPASRAPARRWGAGSSSASPTRTRPASPSCSRRRSSAPPPLLKLPELFGPQGDGVRGQALVGSLCSAATAYLAVRFLMRYFETRTLIPFARLVPALRRRLLDLLPVHLKAPTHAPHDPNGKVGPNRVFRLIPADARGHVKRIEPATTRLAPSAPFQVNGSPRNAAAMTKTRTTLRRSSAATPTVGPWRNATK